MEMRALLSSMWRSRTGPALVAVQVAMALAVLVNVAYVIEQRLAAASLPSGLDLPNMFWVATQADSMVTPDPAAHVVAVKEDLEWLNSLPGVLGAATTDPLPQSFWGGIGLPFAAQPQDLARPGATRNAAIMFGSGRYLDAMGLKLIKGRGFSPGALRSPATTDEEAAIAAWAPEMIVTKAFADALFPDGRALGRTVYAGLINKPAVIVGIVELMRANPLPVQEDVFATQIVILPIITPTPIGIYVVRTRPGMRAALMAKVEKELGDRQPDRFVARVEAYDVTAGRARAGSRNSVIILGVVAALVLAVTVVGIVGLAAFNVASRARQLGTRRALGARRLHIVRYFLIESWITTTVGVVPGCILALGFGLELAYLLEMPRMPLYYLAGGVLLLWLVGLLAVLVPALRAASVSPSVATRTV
jgi:putative ABC transport system permease protein